MPFLKRYKPDPLLKELADDDIQIHPHVLDDQAKFEGCWPPQDNPSAPPAHLMIDLDPTSLGWVPAWWPWEWGNGPLSPEERLEWFRQALSQHLQPEFRETDSASTRKLSRAKSLLRLRLFFEEGDIPTPPR